MKKQKCGKGKMVFPSGSIYEGYWKDDLAHGYGRIIHSDGDCYVGFLSFYNSGRVLERRSSGREWEIHPF
jgi:hypothetical protein